MTTHLALVFACGLAGYLLGAVPFGIVVSHCLGTPDPRRAGSGNIGFTNVLRVGGRKAGVLTLIGDLGKGWVVGWLASTFFTDATVFVVAAMPIFGHLYPVFLKFHGGKGVATALGAVLGVAPWFGLALLIIWLVVAGLWRYSSAAAITAFAALPFLAFLDSSLPFRWFAVVVSVLVLSKHVGNMKRLWAGTEPRIGQRRARSTNPAGTRAGYDGTVGGQRGSGCGHQYPPNPM